MIYIRYHKYLCFLYKLGQTYDGLFRTKLEVHLFWDRDVTMCVVYMMKLYSQFVMELWYCIILQCEIVSLSDVEMGEFVRQIGRFHFRYANFMMSVSNGILICILMEMYVY